MLTQDEENCNIFHMGKYSPLVEIIDSQKGYCLLKNLCSFSDRNYSVGVVLDDGRPHMALDDPDECWVKYDQADEIMRNALGRKNYNKASLDFFGRIAEE